MSDVSTTILASTNKGVHEQLDLLVAAMHIQMIANSPMFRERIVVMSQRDRVKWFKTQLDMAMSNLGHSPGFLMRRLLLHVYELYEVFYPRYAQVFQFKAGTPLTEIQNTLLPLAGAFLDNHFANRGAADICSFLKQDPGKAVPARKHIDGSPAER
jgi:hypothetical protein